MSEVEGFEAFTLYHALKLHFTGKYDYVKYNGKTSMTKDMFMSRKDKFSFYKLSRKYNKQDLFHFYVANLVINPNIWVGDLLTEDAESEFKLWQKVQQSLSYVFTQDIDHMMNVVKKPEDMLRVVDGQYPMLYNEHLRGKVSIETIIIMNDFMNFFPLWQKKIEDDIVFPDFLKKCEKYKPFINYDKPKLKGVLKTKLCQAK